MGFMLCGGQAIAVAALLARRRPTGVANNTAVRAIIPFTARTEVAPN